RRAARVGGCARQRRQISRPPPMSGGARARRRGAGGGGGGGGGALGQGAAGAGGGGGGDPAGRQHRPAAPQRDFTDDVTALAERVALSASERRGRLRWPGA